MKALVCSSMAELSYKLVAVVSFKASGDFLHGTLKNNPHHLSILTPSFIQACHLHSGEHGTKGSIIEWKYTLDGKEMSAKEVFTHVDEEMKHIKLKVVEGDLLELYKEFIIAFDMETKDGVDYISWTLEYELREPENPHPLSTLNGFILLTREAEANLLAAQDT